MLLHYSIKKHEMSQIYSNTSKTFLLLVRNKIGYYELTSFSKLFFTYTFGI